MQKAQAVLAGLLHPPKWVLHTLPAARTYMLLKGNTAVYMLLHNRKMKEVKTVEPLGE